MIIVKDIFLWFWSCIKAVPGSIITGVVISLIFLIFRNVLNKCGEYFVSVSNFLKKLQIVLGEQPEIGSGYQIIQSPKYSFSDKKRKSSVKNPVLWFLLFVVLGGTFLLREYEDIVQNTIINISLFFISSGIFFICISTFTNKIQRSTLLYCIFAILLSFYTYHNVTILPTLILKMPANISIFILMPNSKEKWSYIYMLFGFAITILKIIIILVLFVRMTCIKLDSCKSFKGTRFLIYKTEMFDKGRYLSIFMIFLTVLSYILTSGLFIDLIFKV